VLLIGLAAQLQQNATQRQLQTAFATDTTTITQTLQNKLAVYTNMLVGARTLFAASMSVERDEWHQYISALDIAKDYPGIQSIGFIKHTAATDVQGLIANARSSGANNFTIFPKSSGETYDPVLYVEPRSVTTGKTLGFDMSTDTVRNQAMTIARDQGTPTLSDATTLLQETDNPSRGFLIFVPVYHNGLPATTVAERRAALDGYVYAVFDSAPTIQTMLAGQTDVIDIAVYDNIQTDTSSLLYDTSSLVERNRHGDRIIAASPSNPLLKTTIIYGDNHPWTVQLIAKPNTSKYANNQRAASLVYIVGISLYLLAVSLFYSLRSTRRRSGTATRHKRRNKQ
jgi:CHASE1-domain containing sensor protein